ncbi:XRE family transcriptional regulator [Paenibacillus sambharensis]|uniref:XRE family transcriptional regulator n=1 Tax=Paenibacillus sambharensis TaxID=1803190 RepID=A0A2W1LUM7_9BACL|nr:XRE family transcriptional regulator [Paenibacillus sambharensis]
MAIIKPGRCLIREIRKHKGLSQQRLADLSGVSQTTISNLENNRYLASLTDAKSISIVLRCNIDDLYSWLRPDQE